MISLPDVKGKIVFNEKLAKYTWFNTGGNAEIVFEPKDIDDLQNFLVNIDKKIPITVIGGGSNLLIRDGGIDGVVIILKNNFKKIKFVNSNIVAESGVLNYKLYKFTKEKCIDDYAFLGTIPGTIGGAIKGNAGCYGSEIKDVLISVEALDLNGKIQIFTKEKCNFEYRKNNLPENLIFTKATFKAIQNNTPKEIEKKYQEMLQKRNASQPQGVKTAGSTFKNPLEKPAWKIVQELGYQGKEINGAKMSEKHANFMINTGGAKSKDLEELGNLIIKEAKEKMGIKLEWEIKILGNKI